MASVAEALRGTTTAVVGSGLSGLMVTPHSSPSLEHEKAAVASETAGLEGRKRYWPAIEWLPVQVSISLPIPRFRVRDLLVLNPGQIIATDWPNGDDLPLSADQVQLAWVETESVEQEMAVRITRLL